MRDAGRPVDEPVQRPKLIDPFLPKIEELVEVSEGAVCADVVHERLVGLGFIGDERTTRRAVAAVKQSYRDGDRRQYRPWIAEPGLWLQFDWGAGPVVVAADGRPRPTLLFCVWLAWSRFRVVSPTWDRRLGTLLTCLDTLLRRLGGAPTYALTDNEKTVTVEHVAGVPVRHDLVHDAERVADLGQLGQTDRFPRDRACSTSSASAGNLVAAARWSGLRSGEARAIFNIPRFAH